MADESMHMDRERSRGAKTLEQLLYDVRDFIGTVKDRLLEAIPDKPNKDSRLISYLPHEFLGEYQTKIVDVLKEIEKDDLILEYLREASMQDFSMKLNGIRDSLMDFDSTLDIQGLVKMSKLGKELYDYLKPIAEKTKNIERKTQLYIQEHMLESLSEHVEQYINSETSEPFAIAVLDLNHFKKYNDMTSHSQGDELLKQFAKIMKRNLPGMLARSSAAGDEFYVLAPGLDAEGLKGVIDTKFLKEVESELTKKTEIEFVKKGQQYDKTFDGMFEKFDKKITCAVGISSPRVNGKNLVQRAYARTDGTVEPYASLKKSLATSILTCLPEYKIYKSLTVQEKDLLKEKLAHTLLQEADEAMYTAKAESKKEYALGKNISASMIYHSEKTNGKSRTLLSML